MTIVQSLWIGTALPDLQQLSIRSFLAHGHEYHLYTYGDIEGVPEGTTLRDGTAILPSDSIFCYQRGFGKGSYAAFSNLFRYKLILDRGGWWVDTDVVCLRRLQFDDPFVFATERDTDGTIYCATCIFKCPAGAPILDYCLCVSTSKDRQTLLWAEIGPVLLTDAVKEYGMSAHCAPVEAFNPIHYFDFASVIEPRFDMSRLAQSYSVHLWNQMWKTHGGSPSADPSSDSLYAILRQQYGSSLQPQLSLAEQRSANDHVRIPRLRHQGR
jgi:hypothetical protein